MISFLAPLLGAGSSGVKSTANRLQRFSTVYTRACVFKVEEQTLYSFNPLFRIFKLFRIPLEFEVMF